jgi:hypothetical protein
MSDQPKLFEGYEIQAEYLVIPGISGKLALREFLPAEVEEPQSGDMIELNIHYKLGLQRGVKFGNDGHKKGEIADTWLATPMTDDIRVSAYLTKAEVDFLWERDHGAVGE